MNTKKFEFIDIDRKKYQDRFGAGTLPQPGQGFDGWMLWEPKNGFYYTVQWVPSSRSPFTVMAVETDLRHQGLHGVGYDHWRYLSEIGEKPRVGHEVPGSLLIPEKDGLFLVVSVQQSNGKLLVERCADEEDVTVLLHLDEDDSAAACGVDDITQFEPDPAEFSEWREPDTMLEFVAFAGQY